MSVPKNDEMLAYYNRNSEVEQGIRAILAILKSEEHFRDLLIIRAFVERVENRTSRIAIFDPYERFHLAVRDELAAMEKESNERTDD